MNEKKLSILETLIFIVVTVLSGIAVFYLANRVFEKLASGMDVIVAFDAGILIVGSVIIVFLMILAGIKAEKRTHNELMYFSILALSNLHTIGELNSMTEIGNTVNIYWAQIITMITTPTILIIFWFYQRNVLLGDDYKKTKLDFVVVALGIMDHLQIYYGSFKGKLFMKAADGSIIDGPWRVFTFIYPIIVLIICIIDNFRHKSTRGKHFACFMFAFTPIWMAVVALIVKNYIFSDLAYVVSVLIIFAGIQANNELGRILQKEKVSLQHKLLEEDALTHLYSRFAYSIDVDCYKKNDQLSGLVIFAMDVNGLKGANDTKGHEAGDELIKGAADCIKEAIGEYGKCYRTGGDEFVAIVKMPEEQILEADNLLREIVKNWHGEIMSELSISIGTVSADKHPGADITGLIALADQEMYADKERYYVLTGKDRRCH